MARMRQIRTLRLEKGRETVATYHGISTKQSQNVIHQIVSGDQIDHQQGLQSRN